MDNHIRQSIGTKQAVIPDTRELGAGDKQKPGYAMHLSKLFDVKE